MTALDTSSYRVEDARSALWFGRWPGGWGDVVHGVEPGRGCSAGSMIDAAGTRLDGRAAPARSRDRRPRRRRAARVPVPRVVANVRSDTRAVLGVVGDGYQPLQNRARSRSATRSSTRARRTGSARPRRAAARACTR